MKSSVSSPFIFLKLKEKPTAQKKRVVLPKSLESLRKQTQILFQSPKPIVSFYTETGELIQTVDDLIPSTTILASTLGTVGEEEPRRKYQIRRPEIPKMHGALIDMESSDSDKAMNDHFEEEEIRAPTKPLTLQKKPQKQNRENEILIFHKKNENKPGKPALQIYDEDPLASDNEDALQTDSSEDLERDSIPESRIRPPPKKASDEDEEIMGNATRLSKPKQGETDGSGPSRNRRNLREKETIKQNEDNGQETIDAVLDSGKGNERGRKGPLRQNGKTQPDLESENLMIDSAKGRKAIDDFGSENPTEKGRRNPPPKQNPKVSLGDSTNSSETGKGRGISQTQKQNGRTPLDLDTDSENTKGRKSADFDSEDSADKEIENGKGRKNPQQKQNARAAADFEGENSPDRAYGNADETQKGRGSTKQVRQTKRVVETRKEVIETSTDKTEGGAEEEDDLDEENVDRNILEEMLGVQFCYGNLESDVETVFRGCDQDTKRNYRRMVREMKRQQRSFFQNAVSRLSCFEALTKRDELTLGKALVKRADDIITKFRVIEPGLVGHNLHAFIVGPRESGKSTLLAFVAERLLVSLIRSQTYKRNLVLIFDAKKLSVSFESYKEFYFSFVDIVFDAVAAQRPGFVEFQEAISGYFKEIANGVSETALPKRFATNELFKPAARGLAQLGAQLRKCYSDPSAFEEWHTNVLLMPSLVAAAFGFTQVHYVIDNVEYLDAQITPDHPFIGSPLNIIEYFLYAFSSASYVLACENFEDCMNVFGPNESRINIMRESSVFDVFGMEGDVIGHDKAFMLRFDGDPRLFRFSVEDCCGCPAFLSFWEEICREVESNRDSWNVDVSEYNDQQTTVRECLQHLLKQVFVVDSTSEEAAKISQNEILEIRPIKSVA